MSTRRWLLLALCWAPLGCSHTATTTQTMAPPGGTQVALDQQGRFTIVFQQPAWTFGGALGASPTAVQQQAGTDAVGPYHELVFDYTDNGAKRGGIRAYDGQPVVLFTQDYVAAAANTAPFPTIDTYPQGLYHLAYGEQEFAPRTFTTLAQDSPWVFFDQAADAFILSAASHFMNAATLTGPGGAISAGIDPQVAQIPAGFQQQTLLAVEPGINRAFETWGQALTALTGKQRPPSDATPDLARLGYWTDNGSSYYYTYDQTMGYTGTLLAVRDYFQTTLGVPLAYMQIDSWWYPKGPYQEWNAVLWGLYTYTAAPALFPDGLAAFQAALGLPLVTHSRWIDASSPYRAMYQMSNNVSTDPRYWTAITASIQSAGVITYEQDWLNQLALPQTDNLTDQDAFMDDMAQAAAAHGLSLQYCMPLPRHYLQGAKYDNLITTRVSDDRFEQSKWTDFLYVSRLTSALSAWPWVDVFMSTEEDNLILATLSAGMVGVGDAIGAASKDNLLKSIRADGVIVKPDAPIVPLDDTYIHGAQSAGLPVLAATYTDQGSLRASYVFAFSGGADPTISFAPAALGQTGRVYVFDYYQGTGRIVEAGQSYTDQLTGQSAYYIVVPIGPSGIALLGDQGKYVSLGKKRIGMWSDTGTVSVTALFAAGEGPVVLRGYAPAAPSVTATVGSAGPVAYDAGSQLFTVSVSPPGSSALSATIQIR